MLQHSHLVSIDEQTIAQAELNAYIEPLAQEIAPEIEIDSTPDRTSGTLYRVWHGSHLLGTFKRAVDGLWVGSSIKLHQLTATVQHRS